MEILPTKSLDCYELKQDEPWFDEEFSNSYVSDRRLNCSSYKKSTK
jgi:hypothetical protein